VALLEAFPLRDLLEAVAFAVAVTRFDDFNLEAFDAFVLRVLVAAFLAICFLSFHFIVIIMQTMPSNAS
jgi:hypothetical protein